MIPKIAVIGAGISGMTVANLLKKEAAVTVFERESRPGGLIKCDRLKEGLFHTCGGHVFNSKRQDVLNYFWSFFSQEDEFTRADRNSTVIFNDKLTVPYPIENHVYRFDDEILVSIIKDVLNINHKSVEPKNFEEFLKKQFGSTLYDLYFGPYNAKIWRRELSTVPLSWLEGKLPMPLPEEIIFNNIRKVEEKKFVHSSFWYEKKDGSQFIADRFSKGINIKYSHPVKSIYRKNGFWIIEDEQFDKVVFCGNIRELPHIIDCIPDAIAARLKKLEFHGTTSVFCKIQDNPFSWIYLPSSEYEAHRIICTGNFSQTNNAPGMMTGTVEFTDEIEEEDIKKQLLRIPLSPEYITHKYNPCTYPIQDSTTRELIKDIKKLLSPHDFFITGRFGDWEYYNMDVAIGAAIDTCRSMSLTPSESVH